MPFEARKRMLWADSGSPLDAKGRHTHKYVEIGDELAGDVPPKCILRKEVAEVDNYSGRPWAKIPSHFAPASAPGTPPVARPTPPPVAAPEEPTPVQVAPVEEKPEPAPKPKRRGRPRKAKR